MTYGKALNKGRGLFYDDDKGFGKWKQEKIYSINLINLIKEIPYHLDEQAAMWAAENTDLMYEIMEENPRIKTVRGAHTYVRIA